MHNGVLALYIQVLFRKLVVGRRQDRSHTVRQMRLTCVVGTICFEEGCQLTRGSLGRNARSQGRHL